MTTDPRHQPLVTPAVSIGDTQRRLAVELSTRARVGYVALLLGALGMGTVVVSLWFGEQDLPARTRIAFAFMTIIALCWVGFATWTLARRRVLLGQQDLIAAGMGVTFSSVFFVLFSVLTATGAFSPKSAAVALPAAGLMVILALALLVRARRRIARLTQRRRELERDLGRPTASPSGERP